MKGVLWRFLRSILSIAFMFTMIGVLHISQGAPMWTLHTNYLVIAIFLAFVGLLLIAYCPRCKFMITTKVIRRFWDMNNLDIPCCPKCEKKGLKSDEYKIY